MYSADIPVEVVEAEPSLRGQRPSQTAAPVRVQLFFDRRPLGESWGPAMAGYTNVYIYDGRYIYTQIPQSKDVSLTAEPLDETFVPSAV